METPKISYNNYTFKVYTLKTLNPILNLVALPCLATRQLASERNEKDNPNSDKKQQN